MNKKLLRAGVILGAAVAAVTGMSAFEAHVINVTAHIENALNVDSYGIDFGTVFPQEYEEENFTISLSRSFLEEDRVDDVDYVIKQKPKHWRDDFNGVYPEHRSLSWIDPDNNGSYTENAEGNGLLTITTGDDVEDLFGPLEPTPGTDWTAPRKVMLMGGNFVAETRVVNANPGPYYESAGLLAYGQNGDIVRLEVSNWAKWGMGMVVYMENQESGVKTAKGWDTLSGYGGNLYLRLSRDGDTFKGEYSTDGSSWSEVTHQEGGAMINDLAGKPAMVGVAVVHSDEENGGAFTASFEYLDMNGKYQDFCRFLSKTKVEDGDQIADVDHPSYFNAQENSCMSLERANARDDASGKLTKAGQDVSDTWTVDLKVPPIAGYAAQDWPETCRQDWVVPSEADYGCDLWAEVTGITGVGETSPTHQ